VLVVRRVEVAGRVGFRGVTGTALVAFLDDVRRHLGSERAIDQLVRLDAVQRPAAERQ